PNLASPNNYTALANNLGAVNTGANAVHVVLNILKITSGTGLFILIVGFVIDTGQRSSGLWNRFVDPNLVIGFVAAFLCLFGWPTILSYLTTGVTAMGYYIYNQNTLRTSGVLEGFQNIDLNASGGNNAFQMSQYDFRGNFITVQGITWNLIYLVSLGLVVIGFYNCYSAVSSGESQKGNYKFFQAMAGIILILGMPTLVHILISKGADTIGNQPVIPGQTLPTYSLQGLVQDNGIQYPQQTGQATSNIGTASNTASAPPTSHLAIFSAGLLKCGVAFWGLIICFAVIFAKFFQVLNLWVLFVLGPIFIGCLGHPATVPIFWGAARYFIKLLLYSVIWAITLVGLYLIPNINWGIETIGVNSLLTAVAVLAGLQLIANVQEFASLFTTFSGANLKGEGYKEFTRDTKAAVGGANQARLGTFGVMK
ncbi:MAG TPA: type IV secretion system protein, partial [bacterium]